jgi:predicted dehydrogenase
MGQHGRPLRVGMVGHAFMGAAHTQGWAGAGRFFSLPLSIERTALCGRDADAVTASAARLGWASVETDWRALIARDDIDLIDICTPGDTHADIAIAALEAGKHVLCEKPLANTVAEAVDMADAARLAEERGRPLDGRLHLPRVPAIALAKQLVDQGRLGTIRHVRAQYLQDWIVDPQFPLVWRLEKDKAGSGALGDIGAHVIDLAQHLLGSSISGVSALTETFVKERPLPRRRAACPRAARPRPDRSPSTTPRCSPRASRGVRSARSRPRASPPGARTRSVSRSTGPTAVWRSTSSR